MRVTATDEDKAAELLFGDAEPPAAAAPVKRERELPPAPIAAEKKVKTEGEAAADGGSDVDEESLSSLSDSDAVLQAEQSDCPNLVLCQFETVKKSGKSNWKVKLHHGMVTLNDAEYRFSVAHGNLSRW